MRKNTKEEAFSAGWEDRAIRKVQAGELLSALIGPVLLLGVFILWLIFPGAMSDLELLSGNLYTFFVAIIVTVICLASLGFLVYKLLYREERPPR